MSTDKFKVVPVEATFEQAQAGSQKWSSNLHTNGGTMGIACGIYHAMIAAVPDTGMVAVSADDLRLALMNPSEAGWSPTALFAAENRLRQALGESK